MKNIYAKTVFASAALACLLACGAGGRTQNDTSLQTLPSSETGGQTSSGGTGATGCGTTTNPGDGSTVANPNGVASNGNSSANPKGVDPNTLDVRAFKYVFSTGISTKGQPSGSNGWSAYVFTNDPNACSTGHLTLPAGAPYFFADVSSSHGRGSGPIYFATLAEDGNEQCALFTSNTAVGSIEMLAGAGIYTYSIAAGHQSPINGSLTEPSLPSSDPNAWLVKPCAFPTDIVDLNPDALNPNDNLIDCHR